jgi:divinyl protochlorophyllide a 8-vinyl-reductase
MTVEGVNASLHSKTDHKVILGASAHPDRGPAAAAPRIGPNSIIQTLRALQQLESPEVLTEIKRRAQVPEALPPGMVPEVWFVQLVRAVRATLPADRASKVLHLSGTWTAAYVSKNRIPAPVRAFLAVAPRRLAVPMLLKAFAKNAWTFAGAGRFSTAGGFPGTILLEGCPTARAESQPPADDCSCSYYEAAFEGLLSLAIHPVHVREVACQSRGAAACRFQINLGEPPCASS